MLVDHANPGRNGIRRRSPQALFSANENLTGVWPIHAVEHFHGSGFASAIFANHTVNASRFDVQSYLSVREYRTKTFGHRAQLDCWCMFRHLRSFEISATKSTTLLPKRSARIYF